MNYLYCAFIELLAKYNFPEGLALIIFPLLPFCIIAAGLLIMVLFLVLAERKILGFVTQRKGPNRVGYWGLMQTVADAFKLLCKENITPAGADKFLFTLAPLIAFIPVMLVWGILPYNAEFDLMSTPANLIFYLFLAFMPVLGIFLGGWASNSKYSIIGSVRAIAQAISYELPIAFSVLGIVVLASSLNLSQITLAQSSVFGPAKWFVIPAFIGFIVVFVSVIAELNRCPFDLPEAESELVAGYNTEYSGMRFALFYITEYSMMFANAAFIVVLFLGGYLSPFGGYLSNIIFGDSIAANILVYFEQTFWFLLKTFVILFLFILVRATYPRLQSDKLLKLSWTILLPMSIVNLFVCMLIKTIGGAM